MSHRPSRRRSVLRPLLEVLALFGLMTLSLAFFGLILFGLIWVALRFATH